jgi:hypothetical protein
MIPVITLMVVTARLFRQRGVRRMHRRGPAGDHVIDVQRPGDHSEGRVIPVEVIHHPP